MNCCGRDSVAGSMQYDDVIERRREKKKKTYTSRREDGIIKYRKDETRHYFHDGEADV